MTDDQKRAEAGIDLDEVQRLRQEVIEKVKTAEDAEAGARASYMAVVGTIPNPAVRESFANIDVLIRKSPEAACYALAQFHAQTAAMALGVKPERINEAIEAEIRRLESGVRQAD